jgi:hypothetical protein
MQKLVTICLHGHDARHGAVEEHLTDHLAEGWRVASVCAIGGPTGAHSPVVWVAVVLDKGGPAGQGPLLPGAQMAGAVLNPFFPLLEAPQSEEGHPVEPSDIPVGPDTPLEVGSRVLSFSQGRWWRAEVVALAPEDRVQIHFPGWGDKWDVVVPREELQVDLSASDE